MGKKIALIQDDDCVDVMRLILEDEGFEVSSPQVNQLLLSNDADYDLVIVDEYAQGKTGPQIIPGMELESLARYCHADCYLLKPFDLVYFVNLIKGLYNKKFHFA